MPLHCQTLISTIKYLTSLPNIFQQRNNTGLPLCRRTASLQDEWLWRTAWISECSCAFLHYLSTLLGAKFLVKSLNSLQMGGTFSVPPNQAYEAFQLTLPLSGTGKDWIASIFPACSLTLPN